MSDRFILKGRNPDVLTCIANLSNDEVFTPPEFANRMLDTVAAAWAADHGGADIWANPDVRFLDPFTKSGIFLREITQRLIRGLEGQIPDLQERVDHILTRQVFGIGITKITSLMARRSVYCSKFANGPHSITRRLNAESGNIWFERTEHTWNDKKCVFCGAPKSLMDRGEDVENYAYAFIHTDDIKARISEIFGGDMQFDVIVGNPPYQMAGGAGGSSDSSIYHLFVQQAIKLEPRYVTMVIPSRWMAGGRGLDEFRTEMLNSGQIRRLTDFADSSAAFPGVQIKGGICYFLWDRDNVGSCQVTRVVDNAEYIQEDRNLGEFDVFIRDERAVSILQAVASHKEASMAELISNREPFRLESNFADFRTRPHADDIALYRIGQGKRRVDWIARSKIDKNLHLIDIWKLFIPKAYGAGESIPHQILGIPILASPPSVCTGSYLVLKADNQKSAESILSYYETKFFRFMVSLRKITQDAFSHMYTWVPQQTWDRVWKDEELYDKYGLTIEQRQYIESVIKPMDVSTENSE